MGKGLILKPVTEHILLSIDMAIFLIYPWNPFHFPVTWFIWIDRCFNKLYLKIWNKHNVADWWKEIKLWKESILICMFTDLLYDILYKLKVPLKGSVVFFSQLFCYENGISKVRNLRSRMRKDTPNVLRLYYLGVNEMIGNFLIYAQFFHHPVMILE